MSLENQGPAPRWPEREEEQPTPHLQEKKEVQEEEQFSIITRVEDRQFLRHVADAFIQQVRGQNPPYKAIVFLDRGARMPSHLVKERWKHLFPEDEIPDFKFAKIGKEMGSTQKDNSAVYKPIHVDVFKRGDWRWRNGVGSWDNNARPTFEQMRKRAQNNAYSESIIEELREAFDRNGKHEWDGARVLVVDEYISSGNTLRYAKRLFSSAFPKATIEGAAMMARSKSDFDEMERNKSKYKSPSDLLPVSVHAAPHFSQAANYDVGFGFPRLPQGAEDSASAFIAPYDREAHAKKIEDLKKTELKLKKKSERAWTSKTRFDAEYAARDTASERYHAEKKYETHDARTAWYRKVRSELGRIARS